MEKKITYQDWFEGKAIHRSCEAYFPADEKVEIIWFDWEDVSNEDIIEIKSMQSEIFYKECSRLFFLWKEIFESKLTDYKNKKKYLANELSDIRTILSIDESLHYFNCAEPFLNHKGLIFEEESLNQIRNYFHDVIVVEKNRSFDFIHSKNFKYQHLSKTPCEIYAQVCWDFYNWLIKNKTYGIDLIELSHIDKVEAKSNNDNYNFNSLISIFDNNHEKVEIIKKAIHALNITKDFSVRQITAFVDVSKIALSLPLLNNVKLICAIYLAIGKSIPKNIKSRTDGAGYKSMQKSAKKYYGLMF
jgi:hypothetical protein